MKRRRLAAATFAALAAAGVATHDDRSGHIDGEAVLAATVAGADTVARLQRHAAPLAVQSAPAASLRGTRVDGTVQLDAGGRLVLDVALRRFVDYFLSATGERDAVSLRAALLDASALDTGGRAQLAAFVDRYLAYANDAAAIDPADPADPERGLRERRRRHFGERDAATLFADLEAAADAIARRRADPTDVEPAFLPSEIWRRLDADEARRAALTSTERHAERMAEFGVEAAARFDALDAADAAWDRRVADLRARLSDSHGAARHAALDAALAEGVSPAESRRLRALFAE